MGHKITPSDKEIAEMLKESNEIYDAVDAWVSARLTGGGGEAINKELIEELERLVEWRQTTPVETEEEETHDPR